MSIVQPCVEKIFINLNAPAAFNLRQKVLGDQNTNLQYIASETNANVTLRGRGSGFIEPNLGVESSESLHLYIEHPHLKNLIEAKNLAKNLLETIQSDLQIFLQTNSVTQAIPIQQPPPIIANNQSITIPSAVLSVPPPNIIQNNALQPTHIIQQQNFIPQTQIIPQQMQIIQQTPLNIPPPIRTVQFQGQPTNIQIQQAAGQQILLNQAPAQQYQLQYLPATNSITQQPQTIQHFIQPQQQIQGILQPNGQQQFFTVQGNTAFMIPPPNIVQNPTLFTSAPPIAINTTAEIVDTTKTDLTKVIKQQSDDQKNQLQTAVTSSGRAIMANINQPPPPIQQYILNANSWPQTQQQMPLNSQIQIVTQPQTFRNGNEILIQNSLPTTVATTQGQQQVITTFNPQQGSPLQQIHFANQPILSQPPPPSSIQIQHQAILQASNLAQSVEQQLRLPPTSTASLSYQQQFEQKINMGADCQQRAMKRKIDESESESKGGGATTFSKAGVGAMSKNRPTARTITGQPQQQHQKAGVKNIQMKSSVDAMSANSSSNKNNNRTVFNKNSGFSTSTTTTSMSMKASIPQVETCKTSPSSSSASLNLKGDNEIIEVQNFDATNQAFMVCPAANQLYRFNGPQNFIRQQQPPPNLQQQFNAIPRGQMIMFQTQPPPPSNHMAIQHQQQQQQQQQHEPNFQNINRFGVPRGGGGGVMMPGNNNDILRNANFHQQQQKFRHQW